MPSTVLKLHSGHNFHTKKIYKGAKISQSVSELLSRHNFPAKMFRGITLSKLHVELLSLFSAYCLMVLYICTKFHENIS